MDGSMEMQYVLYFVLHYLSCKYGCIHIFNATYFSKSKKKVLSLLAYEKITEMCGSNINSDILYCSP